VTTPVCSHYSLSVDKKFLDQGSSDEISVSDESDHGARKAAKGSDDDDARSDVSFDDDDPLKTKSKSNGNTPKFIPRALELDNRKAEDIEFERWKSKVGRLDMNVREPLTLLRSSPPKQPRSESYKLKDVNQKSGNSSVIPRDTAVTDKQKRREEQNNVADASDDGSDGLDDDADREGFDDSEESGSDDSFDELDKHGKKKPPSRLMLAFKEIKQSVRSYSDVAKVIVDLPVEIVGKLNSNASENDEDDDEVSRKKNCSIS